MTQQHHHKGAHHEGALRGITNKDVKKMVRKLQKQRWTIETTRSNHIKLHPPSDVVLPNGDSFIVIGMTTGGPATTALRHQLRKAGVQL